jgi:hypothetical protein
MLISFIPNSSSYTKSRLLVIIMSRLSSLLFRYPRRIARPTICRRRYISELYRRGGSEPRLLYLFLSSILSYPSISRRRLLICSICNLCRFLRFKIRFWRISARVALIFSIQSRLRSFIRFIGRMKIYYWVPQLVLLD